MTLIDAIHLTTDDTTAIPGWAEMVADLRKQAQAHIYGDKSELPDAGSTPDELRVLGGRVYRRGRDLAGRLSWATNEYETAEHAWLAKIMDDPAMRRPKWRDTLTACASAADYTQWCKTLASPVAYLHIHHLAQDIASIETVEDYVGVRAHPGIGLDTRKTDPDKTS